MESQIAKLSLLGLVVTFGAGCVSEISGRARCEGGSCQKPDGWPRLDRGLSAEAGQRGDARQRGDTAGADAHGSPDQADPRDAVVVAKDAKPKDAKPKDAKPKDTQPKDTQPKDTQPKDTVGVSSEVLLFDKKSLQFTTSDNGFHTLVAPGDPLPAPNWLAPKDYYNGQFQVRYVVESPSTQQPGQLQTCIWAMPGYKPESCSAMVPFAGPGVTCNSNVTPASWWKLDGVPLDFSHPEKFLIRVVLRGPSGCNVTTYQVANGCWSEWPKYQAMKLRVTVVMVAKGAVFSGWQSYP